MPNVEIYIDGLPIVFPFNPYNVQIDYMKSVIQCLNERRHGVLESPTGTGKTLSLLCSVLAWLNDHKLKSRVDDLNSHIAPDGGSWDGSSIKVIYASRTHSQLKQVINQFNKTSYKHIFKPSLLGSRDHMCVNARVKKENSLAAKNALCGLLVKLRNCRYYNNIKNQTSHHDVNVIEDAEKALNQSHNAIVDNNSCCPYYACREHVPLSDIIFMPYNYLVDFQAQQSFKFSLAGSIVIIDEGHNIAKVCEEAASVTFTSVDASCCLATIKEEMTNLYENNLNEEEIGFGSEDLVFLHGIFSKFEDFFLKIEVPSGGKNFPGDEIFKILNSIDITSENVQQITEIMQKIAGFILSKQKTFNSSKGFSLQKMADNLNFVFSTLESFGRGVSNSFKVFLENDSKNFKKHVSSIRMHFWCFNPSYTLNNLLKYEIRCLIITSGTLVPLDSTIKELGLNNPVILENSHIINPNQVLITTITRGPTNGELKCVYEKREDMNYWREVGTAIENFSRITPDGILVFFPSYACLSKAKECWSTPHSKILDRLSIIKGVYFEPSDRSFMPNIMEKYTSDISNNKGAILFAICRGKISEGVDFSGKFARAVIIIGIPYAPLYDPKVRLKKEFIDSNRNIFQGLTGDTWYHMDAMRAVNQAMGRVIRHSLDYGAILLCDSRFSKSAGDAIPKWLKAEHSVSLSFGKAVLQLRRFFAVAQEEYVDTEPPNPVQASLVSRTSKEESTKSLTMEDVSAFLTSWEKKKLEPPKPTNESLTSLVARAEKTFGIQMLFNPKIAETKIEPNTLINIQPAKKRKIKITHAKNLSESSNVSPLVIDIRKFLLEAKLAMEPDSYATFAFIVKKYQLTNNFDEAVKSLETLLLLQNEPNFLQLFKGSKILFSEDHQKKFQELLDLKYDN